MKIEGPKGPGQTNPPPPDKEANVAPAKPTPTYRGSGCLFPFNYFAFAWSKSRAAYNSDTNPTDPKPTNPSEPKPPEVNKAREPQKINRPKQDPRSIEEDKASDILKELFALPDLGITTGIMNSLMAQDMSTNCLRQLGFIATGSNHPNAKEIKPALNKDQVLAFLLNPFSVSQDESNENTYDPDFIQAVSDLVNSADVCLTSIKKDNEALEKFKSENPDCQNLFDDNNLNKAPENFVSFKVYCSEEEARDISKNGFDRKKIYTLSRGGDFYEIERKPIAIEIKIDPKEANVEDAFAKECLRDDDDPYNTPAGYIPEKLTSLWRQQAYGISNGKSRISYSKPEMKTYKNIEFFGARAVALPSTDELEQLKKCLDKFLALKPDERGSLGEYEVLLSELLSSHSSNSSETI